MSDSVDINNTDHSNITTIPHLTLRIDNREVFRDRLSTSVRHVDSKATISIEALPVGDFLFEWDSQPILVIERKTLADYAQSIRDGRHREQKRRLFETYGKQRVLFIIEGDLTESGYSSRFSKVPIDTLVSSIVNTMLRDQMHVFHTASDHETIEFLTLVYKKCSKGIDFLNEPSIGGTNDASQSSEYLYNPSKSVKNAQLTPIRTFQLMLNSIPGVSDKVSERIVSKHPSMTDFISRLQSSETYNETVAYVETIGNGRRIPKTTAQRIVDYLGIYSSE
jgi:ERCC4-type nuclease